MISLEMVRSVCACDAARLRAVLEFVLLYQDSPPDDEPLPAGQALVLWVADLLGRLQFGSPETQLMLLKRLSPVITDYGVRLWAAVEGRTPPPPPLHLGIADREWGTSTATPRFHLNLVSGVVLEALPTVPLETIAYNLSVLFTSRLTTARRQAKVQDGQKQRDGGPEIPVDG